MSGNRPKPSFPARAAAVTPNDSTRFVPSTIYVGTTGDVAVQPADNAAGDTVTFTALPAGAVVPCLVVQVLATGTTASDLVRVA